MTAAGYAALGEELRRRQQEDRPRIIQQIAEARAHGDLSENAEYHAAKESQSLNEGRIAELEENAARLPESIRSAWNLPLLLETAVELARRKAMTDWSLAVPQLFQSRMQYLLPIHLTNMERPDLAMALSIMEGYYIGHTCLTLEMAYQNARLLARPTAGWLAELVE